MSRSSGATKLLKPAAIAVLMTSVFGLASAVQAYEIRPEAVGQPEHDHLQPTGRGFGVPDPSGAVARNAQKFSSTSTNGIVYHGGPLLGLGTGNPVNMYYIWYGAWDYTTTTNGILNTFGSYVGGTHYFGINTTYYDGTNTKVSGLVAMPSPNNAVDKGSQGTALNDAAVQTIVANAISSGSVPNDTNGVYFVLTSREVTETSGFCTKYCAWHTHGTINGNDIKYGFVGSPLQCPSACSAQSTSPSGNMEADGMANLLAHELAEATTDPDLNAWFDRRGYENADKCAWKFGATSTTSSGAKYNVTFGGANWLLQQNWINAGGGSCTLSN